MCVHVCKCTCSVFSRFLFHFRYYWNYLLCKIGRTSLWNHLDMWIWRRGGMVVAKLHSLCLLWKSDYWLHFLSLLDSVLVTYIFQEYYLLDLYFQICWHRFEQKLHLTLSLFTFYSFICKNYFSFFLIRLGHLSLIVKISSLSKVKQIFILFQ